MEILFSFSVLLDVEKGDVLPAAILELCLNLRCFQCDLCHAILQHNQVFSCLSRRISDENVLEYFLVVEVDPRIEFEFPDDQLQTNLVEAMGLRSEEVE